MSTEAAGRFAAWLHQELIDRDYDLDGRSGGRDRFAKAANVSPALVSRTLSGERIPDFPSLKKIARALGVSLATVLIAAEQADREDLIVPEAKPAATVDDIPAFIDSSSIPAWEWTIWNMGDRTLRQRNQAIEMLRIMWGDLDAESLTEDTPEPRGRQERRIGGA